MRITGGEFAGRRISVSGKGVRPTTDKTREALFSIIAHRVPGARFLDLFAGSGSVGFDAWSRGASRICWVESGRRTVSVLKNNVADLGVAGAQVYAAEVVSKLQKGFAGEQFDIIFADPPYDWNGGGTATRSMACVPRRASRQVAGACFVLAESIRCNNLLAEGGVLIIERGANDSQEVPPGWRLIDFRKYGKTRLLFFCQEDPLP